MNKYGVPYRPIAPDGWREYPSGYMYGGNISYHSESMGVWGNVIQSDGSLGDPYTRNTLPWIGGKLTCSVDSPQYNLLSPFPTASYPTKSIASSSVCRTIGYKNLQAHKQWNGRFGYIYKNDPEIYDYFCFTETTFYPDGSTEIYGGFSDTKNISASLTASQVKYRTTGGQLSGSITLKYPDGTPYSQLGIDINSTMTVGRYTGVLTGSGNMSTSSVIPYSSSCEDGMLNTAQTIWNDIYNYNYNDVFVYFTQWLTPYDWSLYAVRSGSNTYQLKERWTSLWYGWPDEVVEEITITSNSFSRTMNLYTVCYDSASTPYLHSEQTLSETVGISDSQMLWTIYENIQLNTPGPCAPLDVEHTGSNPVGCLPDTFDREIIQLVYSGTLSNPYSASAVISDCNDLASYWDLTNNVIYPWRTDGYCNIAPKMTYNEPQYNVEPFLSLTPPFSDPVTLEPTWTDPNSYLFDGAVLGKPNYNPTGSVINRNNFDPRYLFYFWGLVSSHGDYNNGQFGLPLAATQWTNYWEARDYPIASFTFCKGSVGVTIQKYAEIKAKWQSWDFNRPYGADRFMEDEEGVCCNPIILSPGRIQLMENDGEVTAPTPPPIPGNVWAGTHISGCYTIASVEGEGTPFDPFILTLGTKLWDLPSNITYPMSRLRFPTCPPIGLEQVSITYNTSSGFSFYTFETPQYYYVTSSIDIYDGRFNNNGIFVPYQKIATGVTMSKVTDLVGTSGGDYRSGSFVIGYGQQPWWTDNGSKGECCTFSWIHDHRTNAEYDRITLILDCTGSIPPRPIRNNGFYSFTSGSIILPGKSIYGLPVENPCNYNVVCYSPNGENFGSSSITYPLVSSTHGLDEYYSSLWQNEFVQNIQSPIYQIPHKDCDFTGSMVVLERDDGTCKSPYNDESGYYHQIYPYPPQIEPFITLPTTTTLYGSSSTAPNPSASGLAWGVISPVSNSNGLQPPTNAGFDGDGFPVEGVYAWQLINNVCSNISSSCSASYTYITC